MLPFDDIETWFTGLVAFIFLKAGFFFIRIRVHSPFVIKIVYVDHELINILTRSSFHFIYYYTRAMSQTHSIARLFTFKLCV